MASFAVSMACSPLEQKNKLERSRLMGELFNVEVAEQLLERVEMQMVQQNTNPRIIQRTCSHLSKEFPMQLREAKVGENFNLEVRNEIKHQVDKLQLQAETNKISDVNKLTQAKCFANASAFSLSGLAEVTVTSVCKTVKEIMIRVFEVVKNFLQNVWKGIKDHAHDAVQSIVDGIISITMGVIMTFFSRHVVQH